MSTPPQLNQLVDSAYNVLEKNTILIRNKIENKRPASNYRGYSFNVNRKILGRMKLQTLQALQFFIKTGTGKSRSVVGGAHIQACIFFSSQDRGRLTAVHASMWTDDTPSAEPTC